MRLGEQLASGNDQLVVAAMKRLVPEYVSHNSVFSNLDAPAGNG